MNINPLNLLPAMLRYSRPHESEMEQAFIDRFIKTLPNVQHDEYRNYYVEVGSNPNTLFSAHIDTVDWEETEKNIFLDPQTQQLFTDNGDCLGADDTTGIWIMTLMIIKQIPGTYVFHRGEESGCLGSGWLADNRPDWLGNFDHAIAFDRAGTRDIITSQRGRVCASNSFARDLSSRLFGTGHIGDTPHKAASGVYTDTAEYTHLISECTNVSVGYESQHTPDETQCINTLKQLVPALLDMNWAGLSTERAPTPKPVFTYPTYGWDNKRTQNKSDFWANEYSFYDDSKAQKKAANTGRGEKVADYQTLLEFVEYFPSAAADLLLDFRVTEEELDDMISMNINSQAEIEEEETLDDYYPYLGLAHDNN
jgi:hypothetical protein